MDFFEAHDLHPWLLLLGCVFCPRFVIAVLSLAYWNTNPVLVVCAWGFSVTGAANSCNETKKRVARRDA